MGGVEGAKGAGEMVEKRLLPPSGFQEKGFFPKSSSLPSKLLLNNSHGGRVTYLVSTFRKKDLGVQPSVLPFAGPAYTQKAHAGGPRQGKRVSPQSRRPPAAARLNFFPQRHLPPRRPRCLRPLTAWERAAGSTPSDQLL